MTQSTLPAGGPAPPSPNKCAICGKAQHDRKTEDKEKTGCLESRPANLRCSALTKIPPLPNYTTAAHHLIPANQCLKSKPHLSSICKTVGYDVNNPENGLSLPTVGQKEENVYGPAQVAYSRLAPKHKQKVAFLVMEGTGLQWHVGHHNWKSLNTDTDVFAHQPNYDRLVKKDLQTLENRLVRNGKTLCEMKEEDRDTGIIAELNSLSSKIEGGVVGWKLYFVSAVSCVFARECR